MDFIKRAANDVLDTFMASSKLVESLKTILKRYQELKQAEADLGDAQGIVVPGASTSAGPFNYQFLHSIGQNTMRFFCCRYIGCGYFGLNTSWASTVPSGGWQFACPMCGQQYRVGQTSTAVMPGHHVWYMKQENLLLISEWPASAEEDTLASLMAALAEDEIAEFIEMPEEEIEACVATLLKAKGAPHFMKPMKMPASTEAWFEGENQKRSKQKPWSWERLKSGFGGSFVKYVEGVTPVMKVDDTKRTLAAVKVLMTRRDPLWV